MAEAILGTKSVVWGLATVPSATGMGTAIVVQSADFKVESESAEFKNAVGQTVAKIYYNQKETMTIEVVPSSTSVAFAQAGSILPLPGTVVTVTDASDTEVAGSTGANNAWIFVSGSKKKSNTGFNMLTFELERWTENNVAQVIS